MALLFESVQKYFSEQNWHFEVLEGKTILRTRFRGEQTEWTCFAQTREQQQQFIFYSRASVQAPEERRMAVAEFLCRANYGMILGNFELDFEDGEVRFKTSADVEGVTLASTLIHNLVSANLTMMEKYVGGVMGVAFGGKSPKEAIMEIEAPLSPAGSA